jgi:voltage-gated potassium channel
MKKIYKKFEYFIAKLMFVITIIFLFLIALMIQYLQTDKGFELLPYSEQIITITLILWPIFLFERLFYLIFCDDKKTWKNYLSPLLVTLFPALHLVTRPCGKQEYILWSFRWQLVTPELYKQIEKTFLYPILIISIIMIPFWITEIFYPEKMTVHPLFHHLINRGNALIWVLFVTEFFILFSIAEKRIDYLKKHWMEILIIILPMLALTRFILISRSLFFTKGAFLFGMKIQRLLNIYRSRVVLNRVIRILVIINIVKRFYRRRNPEKYLIRLQNQLTEKEKEITDLKIQIDEMEQLIGESCNKKN